MCVYAIPVVVVVVAVAVGLVVEVEEEGLVLCEPLHSSLDFPVKQYVHLDQTSKKDVMRDTFWQRGSLEIS